MTKYIALLRGINVGGNKIVRMELLKKSLEELGYENVKTLLNSGNVVFEASEKDTENLQKEIKEKLEKTFGFHIPVLLRTDEQLKDVIASDPFKRITITDKTRLYVTFLSEKPTSTLSIPYTSPENDFQILAVSETEVISILDLSVGKGTPEAMGMLEKEFGKKITTRNWNTVLRIANL